MKAGPEIVTDAFTGTTPKSVICESYRARTQFETQSTIGRHTSNPSLVCLSVENLFLDDPDGRLKTELRSELDSGFRVLAVRVVLYCFQTARS